MSFCLEKNHSGVEKHTRISRTGVGRWRVVMVDSEGPTAATWKNAWAAVGHSGFILRMTGDAQRPDLHFKMLTGDHLEEGAERATLDTEKCTKQPSQSFGERRQTHPSVANTGGLGGCLQGPKWQDYRLTPRGEMRERAVNVSPGTTQAPGGRASTGRRGAYIHSTGAWLGGKRMSSGHDCSARSDDQGSTDQKWQEAKGKEVCWQLTVRVLHTQWIIKGTRLEGGYPPFCSTDKEIEGERLPEVR